MRPWRPANHLTRTLPCQDAKTSTTPAISAVIAPVVSYKPGQNLVALKDKAECRETGADAGEPWKLTKGSTVSFIRVEGSGLLVDSGGGVRCIVAANDVGPS